MKNQKHVRCQILFLEKNAGISHYIKPTQEKSPAEIIIHVGTNNLSSDKEPKDTTNDIIQLAKSVKTDANKVAVSSILPRKGKFNGKAKEVNTHLQDICSANNLHLIIHRNVKPYRHLNIKGLHLNSQKQSPRGVP